MNDPQAYYDLVDEAAAFHAEHGTVDLVALTKAAEMGVPAGTFESDVLRTAAQLERQ